MSQRAFEPGDIQSAVFAPPPSFSLTRTAPRGRKAEGLRYERKAQTHLEAQSEYYLPGPWLLFIAGGRPHWCQPDGLHFDFARGVLTIVEIKYSHTAEAYRQLRRVYAPVLARIFPQPLWTIRLVELVKWYDPAIEFPEPIRLCADPFDHTSDAIGVHIWKP